MSPEDKAASIAFSNSPGVMRTSFMSAGLLLAQPKLEPSGLLPVLSGADVVALLGVDQRALVLQGVGPGVARPDAGWPVASPTPRSRPPGARGPLPVRGRQAWGVQRRPGAGGDPRKRTARLVRHSRVSCVMPRTCT